MDMDSHRNQHGFTLIELMIVVVIVAILATIAIPGYAEYTRKSRRAEAMTALQRLVTQQEKYFLNNATYTDDLSELGYSLDGGSYYTENKYYTLSVATDAGSGAVSAVVASASGSQASDETCQSFWLYLDGTKEAMDENSGNSTTSCW